MVVLPLDEEGSVPGSVFVDFFIEIVKMVEGNVSFNGSAFKNGTMYYNFYVMWVIDRRNQKTNHILASK